jgi:hypothetical protein
MKFLLCCSQGAPDATGNLGEFRSPELNSIAALFDFEIKYQEPVDTTVSPFEFGLRTELTNLAEDRDRL